MRFSLTPIVRLSTDHAAKNAADARSASEASAGGDGSDIITEELPTAAEVELVIPSPIDRMVSPSFSGDAPRSGSGGVDLPSV